MNLNPLVSIIIPTYNRAYLIGETLDSILAQTYANWECIVVDDRSTDETVSILENYCKNDDRFRYIIKASLIKQGASISRNIGLNEARGEYIQFLDSDDILANHKIEKQLNLLIHESKFTISTCKWGKFDRISDSLKIFENCVDYRNFENIKDYFDLIGLYGGFFPSHNFLMSKEIVNFIGYWNENLAMNDDGEFFFRLLLNSNKIVFENETYVLYRTQNKDNLSLLNSKEKAIGLINSWKLIESLYITKYQEKKSTYINKKKEAIYNELKNEYYQLIIENRYFFSEQLNKDTLILKLIKLKKRIKNKIKITLKYK